jgi:hypothetical protein
LHREGGTGWKHTSRSRLGIHNLPNSYLHAPTPYGLGLYDLDREGARDVLLAVGTLNSCPADIGENIARGYLNGLQRLGQCCRTTVPQDGEWFRRGACENTLAGDVIDACQRLDTVVTWDCGECNQKGPLLVQRGLSNGKGLVPRPDIPGQCTIIRPDPERAWLELWQVGGEVVPIIPVPAEFAEYLRGGGHTTSIQTGPPSTQAGIVTPFKRGPSHCTHHLGPLCTHGLYGDDFFLQRMGRGGVTYGVWNPPTGWIARPGETPPPARWEPVAAQQFRWWMGGLSDTSGALLPEVAEWLGWTDCDRSQRGFETERQGIPNVPQIDITPSLLDSPELRNLYPIMDRGTAARKDSRSTVVPIRVNSRRWRPGTLRQDSVEGRIYLQPRRVAWLEQRHQAGLGTEATPAAWFDQMGKTARADVDFLTLTSELEYLLTNVFHLEQQVGATAFSAMRSATTSYFRNPVDGPLGHPILGMYPTEGTTCVFPTDREMESLLHNADANWETSTVSVAVLVPTELIEKAQAKVQHAAHAQFIGYGNYGQWLRSLKASWGNLEQFMDDGRVAIHLRGTGTGTVFSDREVAADNQWQLKKWDLVIFANELGRQRVAQDYETFLQNWVGQTEKEDRTTLLTDHIKEEAQGRASGSRRNVVKSYFFGEIHL